VVADFDPRWFYDEESGRSILASSVPVPATVVRLSLLNNRGEEVHEQCILHGLVVSSELVTNVLWPGPSAGLTKVPLRLLSDSD